MIADPSRRRRSILPVALSVAGVLALTVAAWSRLLRDRDRVDARLVLLVAAGLVVLICGGLWWPMRASRRRWCSTGCGSPA